MSEWQQDVAWWGSVRIEYRYRHAARTTLAISVHPDLSVSVRAPERATPERIRQKVARRGAWIEKSRRDRELYLPKQPRRRYVSGETHRYLGRQYRLKVIRGAAETVKCLRGYLWVSLPEVNDPARIKAALDRWYLTRAKDVFQECVKRCSAKTARVGIIAPSPTIRKMTSRWGSCSRNGRITLNLELIKAPKECIDYVIFHEFCHLKERHHGPRYWSLLRRLVPDFEDVRRRLNQLAHQ
jgi:predicted metal-dependent hydrolase